MRYIAQGKKASNHLELLGANCEFAQFINCAAHYMNPHSAQQCINRCANCES